jgi:hypothetical protein
MKNANWPANVPVKQTVTLHIRRQNGSIEGITAYLKKLPLGYFGLLKNLYTLLLLVQQQQKTSH